MVDLKILESRGVSVKGVRAAAEADKPSEAWEKCRKRMWGRAQDGVTYNCKEYKVFLAIDKAFDATFYQLSPTLVQGLANQDPNKNTVYEIYKALDLTHYLRDEKDAKTGKPTGRRTLDLPTFFSVTVAIVHSYVINRWAKLCNDRDATPFLTFRPMLDSPDERARCEALTSRIELMSNQYNYKEVSKQSVLKMLLYSEVLRFIETEWDMQEQVHYDAEGKEQVERIKEGLNYHIPHPTRTYRDRSYPGSRFLTDTGPQWAGYWRLKRYGEIKDNPAFWNREKIAVGNDWISTYSTYFQTVYPCVMNFPQQTSNWSNDAQDQVSASHYYNSNYEDCATMVVEHFEKLVPKDNGLGDYEYPVWFRFVFAGDGTVIYGAPLPACPVIYYGDSVDDGRLHSPSMALRLVSFQDAVSNALTQAILSARQNLGSMVWVDSNVVDDPQLREIENAGESFYRTRKFFLFDSRRSKMAQTETNRAIFPVTFPQMNVGETIGIVNTLLNILERVIQISAQEVGAAASHEQTKAELNALQGASSNQLKFTAGPIDRADDAWKRQLYCYLMNYGEDEIWAQIPFDPQLTPEVLGQLGFTVDYAPPAGEGGRYQVRARKSALAVDYFLSSKPGDDRTNQVELANAMAQFMPAVLGNQAILQSIGPDQAISLLNQVFERMGLPKDFKLRNVSPSAGPQEFMQQVMEQIQPMIAQASQQTIEQVMKALEPVIKKLQAMTEQNGQAIEKITEALSSVSPEPQPQPQIPNDQMRQEPMAGGQGAGGPGMVAPAGGNPVPGPFIG